MYCDYHSGNLPFITQKADQVLTPSFQGIFSEDHEVRRELIVFPKTPFPYASDDQDAWQGHDRMIQPIVEAWTKL